jgi:hypothetical protein
MIWQQHCLAGNNCQFSTFTSETEPKTTNPPYLRMAGFMSPLALPATDFLVRPAHHAPDFGACHHAPHHGNRSLIKKDFL